MAEQIIKLDSMDVYNELHGIQGEACNPLVGVVNSKDFTRIPDHFTLNYGMYALFLKNTNNCTIHYGRNIYDYKYGTITSFAPGQVVKVTHRKGNNGTVQDFPECVGLLFHPDLIKGTALAREIKGYSFFSYSSNEALHTSVEERGIFLDCLEKIKFELNRPLDAFTRKLIARNIQLLLDYCMRFYARQFDSRKPICRDVLTTFEHELDDYFTQGLARKEGLPTVRYFADKACLSPNYFGDLIKRETGTTAQEYIQNKLMDLAKERLLGTEMTVSQIADELGFQYPQHLNRIFKKTVGVTPSSYRSQGV